MSFFYIWTFLLSNIKKIQKSFKKSATFQRPDIFLSLYLKYFGIEKITDNNAKDTIYL